MEEAEAGEYATVGARIEREAYERFSDICEAAGTTRSAYLRTLVLREIAGEGAPKLADSISTMTIGAAVSQKLLAAIPPDILDEAVVRLRRQTAAEAERRSRKAS